VGPLQQSRVITQAQPTKRSHGFTHTLSTLVPEVLIVSAVLNL
jgi:hypothetical protein